MNPKLILALSILGVLVISNTVVAYKFFGWGQADRQADWDKATNAATDEKLDIRGKQDEIRNTPIDNAVTDRRLLNGSF